MKKNVAFEMESYVSISRKINQHEADSKQRRNVGWLSKDYTVL
jgi:hypothetical protein